MFARTSSTVSFIICFAISLILLNPEKSHCACLDAARPSVRVGPLRTIRKGNHCGGLYGQHLALVLVGAAAERAELDACAKKAQVEKTDGLDNKALKIAIVKALRGDSVDFEGKTDDYINAYYDSIKNDLNDTDEAVRQQLNKARQKLDGQESQTPAAKHRQDMIDRMTNKKEEK